MNFVLSSIFLGAVILVTGCCTSNGMDTNKSGDTNLFSKNFSAEEKLFTRDFSLKVHGLDTETGIRLIKISKDLVVTIRLRSGELLSQKVGEYYNSKQLGRQELISCSASYSNGVAAFKVTESVWQTSEK